MEQTELMRQFSGTLLCFVISMVIVAITIVVVSKATRYDDWEEIKNGNMAAAMVLGGNILGIGNIMRFAVTSNSNPLEMLLWGMVGIVLLVLVHLIYDRLLPRLEVESEIKAGNKAVGFVVMMLLISLSYVIGASIS